MTANRCQATTQDGTPCQAYALAGSDYCFHHDPTRAAERRQARSKGGRARHGRHVGSVGQAKPVVLDTMADVATLLERAINETLQLENSIQRARTLGYLANLFIKALKMTPFFRSGGPGPRATSTYGRMHHRNTRRNASSPSPTCTLTNAHILRSDHLPSGQAT